MWVEHVSGGSGMLLSMEYKACVFSLDSIQVVWDCNNAGCDTAGTVIEEKQRSFGRILPTLFEITSSCPLPLRLTRSQMLLLHQWCCFAMCLVLNLTKWSDVHSCGKLFDSQRNALVKDAKVIL